MSLPLTPERLKELLHYDPETGIFTWLVDRGRGMRIRAGDQAGGADNTRCGRLRIRIDNTFYEASHLAWFYMHQVWPDRLIDHENHDASDNTFNNLRPATTAQNNANARTYKNNKLGIKGVRLHSNGKYEARISINGRSVFLGKHDSPMKARAAYDAAARQHYGEFACLD